MKRVLISILASLLSINSFAQSPEKPLAKVVVADILKNTPAKTVDIHNNQMRDMVLLGDEGMNLLFSMIQSDMYVTNTEVEQAISGLVRYASSSDMDDVKNMVTSSLIKALDKVNDKDNDKDNGNTNNREVETYFINQLEIISTVGSIATLKRYALSEGLYKEALNALATINTKESIAAIVDIAPNVKDKRVIAQAVSKYKIKELEPLMVRWFKVKNKDIETHKSVILALVQVGSQDGIELLAKEAKKIDYKQDQYDLTLSLSTLLTTVPYDQSSKYAELLNKKSDNYTIRVLAMDVIIKGEIKDATSRVMRAMDDEDRSYRNAVLTLYNSFNKEEVASELIDKFDKYDDITKGDIIKWAQNAEVDIPANILINSAKSTNNELSTNSIKYLVAANNSQSVDILIDILTTTESKEVATTIGYEMLQSEFTEFTNQHLQAIIGGNNNSKRAVLTFLANRRVSEMMPFVIEHTTSSDNEVKKAAYKALARTATSDDTQYLFDILNEAEEVYVEDIQNAIIEQLKKQEPKDALAIIKSNIHNSNKIRTYALYCAVPTKTTLSALTSALASSLAENTTDTLKSNNAATKVAIIKTLCKWNNKDAIKALYKVYNDTLLVALRDEVLASSLRLIDESEMSDTWKFIMLRQFMDKATDATDVSDQNKIIQSIGKCNSLNSIIYTAPYMDNKKTSNSAMQAVASIALKDKEYRFYGTNVKNILNHYISLLTGEGSEALGNTSKYLQEILAYMKTAPEGEPGYISIFNGKDLSGWKGLVKNPIARSKMGNNNLIAAQKAADIKMHKGWKAIDGNLLFTGKGSNICTVEKYDDFEMYVDWKIGKHGNAGVCLRGVPQVQAWDTCRVEIGAQVGSGGIYHNKKNPSTPLVIADNATGEWNTFFIKMVGDRVTVFLNGQKVVDNVIMENYWDRESPIYVKEQIELKAHGKLVEYRDIYVKKLVLPN